MAHLRASPFTQSTSWVQRTHRAGGSVTSDRRLKWSRRALAELVRKVWHMRHLRAPPPPPLLLAPCSTAGYTSWRNAAKLRWSCIIVAADGGLWGFTERQMVRHARANHDTHTPTARI